MDYGFGDFRDSKVERGRELVLLFRVLILAYIVKGIF